VLKLLNQALDGFQPQLIGIEIAHEVPESQVLL
jgi:hypothetical protein